MANFNGFLDNSVDESPPQVSLQDHNETPRMMVMTVNVEAGSRCADQTIEGDYKNQISRCVWGEFEHERAGIIEMMNAADSSNVTISFLMYLKFHDKRIQIYVIHNVFYISFSFLMLSGLSILLNELLVLLNK